MGSPPRLRERQLFLSAAYLVVRITPAPAGKTRQRLNMGGLR